MTFNVGDKVVIYGQVVQKIENEEGFSYDITVEDPKKYYHTLRVKEKDLHIVSRG